MASPPADRCRYTWPRDHERDDLPNQQSCCWRETAAASDRCVWHAGLEPTAKSVDRLRVVRVPTAVRGQNAPYAELLDGATLENTTFTGATLRETRLPSESELATGDFEETDMDPR